MKDVFTCREFAEMIMSHPNDKLEFEFTHFYRNGVPSGATVRFTPTSMVVLTSDNGVSKCRYQIDEVG